MTKQSLQVRFLKGSNELSIKEGETMHGRNPHDESYVMCAPDGNVYLMAARGVGRVTRYHFHRGDVSGAFTNEQVRQKYMDTINKAARETVVVAAEAA